ncbi:phosphatase [Rhizobium leguminosarum]|uniref:metallophosphoesterase n=1 Tax=Rhizobium leguminosarum TaxID=384 RepID=UPI0010306330|nr:metallophosphoesterase [Rhizobium leguminosarum]TAX99536.1 phosphatase [Rhizobium leguminosarum]
MKIWVFSDLHLEFGVPFKTDPPKDVDVVVCAGDVLTRGIVPSMRWLAENVARKIPVVFVAGNHEFYGSSIVDSLREVEQGAGFHKLHFLENAAMEIDGVAFIGGTLWSDFRLFGRNPEVAMSYARSGMNDYKKIKLSKLPFKKFKPMDAYRKHVETKAFIAAELRERVGQTTVVVTHHAPSPRSVASWFRHDPISACYASDLEDLICETAPTLWVHGHIHHRNDYMVGSTRIVSNAKGYPGEGTGFDPGFTVDV